MAAKTTFIKLKINGNSQDLYKEQKIYELDGNFSGS